MTSTPPPQPPGRPVAQVIRPLRDLTAYAFVAAPALWLFVAVIRLIPSGIGQDFLTRAQNCFYSFVNVEMIVLPLAAVLLATGIQPVHKHAKLITIVALVEYVTAAFFAAIFGFLIALVKLADFSARVAFEELLVRVAWLAVFAAAAYAVFLIWRNLYYTPRPKAQPGMYGQPPQWQQQYGQPGYPQQQPGQPGFPPPAGYPGYAQPGQTQPQNQPAGPTQPLHPAGYPQPGQPQPGQPQPGQWGQPPAGQGWGAPTSAPPAYAQPAFAPPASAPPASPVSAQPTSSGAPGTPPGPFAPAPGHPQAPYGQPAYPPPGQPQPGYADPTQAIPHRDSDDDRTRIVGEDPPPRP
ncbi:hypothetical protein DMB66_44270 [Actinoplanes sp. ATCC 53533]|uniref:hypothetical protein n=1 Tax=Actinoplanes sp. ATCC 53533 TaxID=1288362 RepID=UPI000F7A0A51|nr:hypothetical protein [Actinoplanes sp. ATCC 53533]RSM49871.1 hypothetical protein DMB66_44270 [Actinoplanes sp. ATCC 53533]